MKNNYTDYQPSLKPNQTSTSATNIVTTQPAQYIRTAATSQIIYPSQASQIVQ